MASGGDRESLPSGVTIRPLAEGELELWLDLVATVFKPFGALKHHVDRVQNNHARHRQDCICDTCMVDLLCVDRDTGASMYTCLVYFSRDL